jgi:hypothetical protein
MSADYPESYKNIEKGWDNSRINIINHLIGKSQDKCVKSTKNKKKNLEDIDIIDNNEGCLSQMGFGNWITNYKCDNCLVLGRLCKQTKGEVKRIDLETENYEDFYLQILKERNVDDPLITDDKTIKTRVKELSEIGGLNECGSESKYRAIGSDRYMVSNTWLNGILINWLISNVPEIKDTGRTIPIIKAFICNGNGYQVTKLLKENTIKPLSERIMKVEDIWHILRQLSLFFINVSRYDFIHGSATYNKLYVDETPYAYVSCGNKYDCEFKLIVTGFHMSSININGNRIMPDSKGRDVDIENAVKKFEKIEIDSDSESKSEDKLYVFAPGSIDGNVFTVMRYSGYPLFGGAYDIYSFFGSLMSLKSFGDIVDDSVKLSNVWTSMFLIPTESPDIKRNTNIQCSYEMARQLDTVLVPSTISSYSGSTKKLVMMYCDAAWRLNKLVSK